MAEITPEIETFARIKVVGVGGAGNSAVNRMIKSKLQGVEFIVMNTDGQALHHSQAPFKVHIGRETTKGLGAGADPEVGRRAAEESAEEIFDALKGSDMAFITYGLGGGTGGGGAPLIAAAAKETGALVVGIVTRPFAFEGERRRRNAEAGLREIRDNVDTLITIPNDRLLQMIDRKTSLIDAFGVVDNVLYQGVKGISDLITIHGLINLDFADVKTIVSNAGSALMGIGTASGENRAVEAARQAIDSPLLEVSVEGAKGVLFNITGGRNMTMHEIDEAAKTITDAVDTEANIIFGAVLDESMDDDIKITVVATGFEPKKPITVQRPATAGTLTGSGIAETRKPFINEKPLLTEEEELPIITEPVLMEERPYRRPAVSIEPEADELEAASPMDESNTLERAEAKETADDLDVPAFIRKKIE